MAFGNYCQHIFVDPDDNANNFTLTYNAMGTQVNGMVFNDGYHIVHHIASSKHWTEIPLFFIQNIEKFEMNKALLFKGLF